MNFVIFEIDREWCQNRGEAAGVCLCLLRGRDVGFECSAWTNSFWRAALFRLQVTEVIRLSNCQEPSALTLDCFLNLLHANLTLEETEVIPEALKSHQPYLCGHLGAKNKAAW